jgi:hypothetical protein
VLDRVDEAGQVVVGLHLELFGRGAADLDRLRDILALTTFRPRRRAAIVRMRATAEPAAVRRIGISRPASGAARCAARRSRRAITVFGSIWAAMASGRSSGIVVRWHSSAAALCLTVRVRAKSDICIPNRLEYHSASAMVGYGTGKS